MENFVWSLVLVFAASAILTGALRRYALRRNLLDHPNHRSSHAVATPRGGGLSIVIVVFATAALLFLFERLSTNHLLALTVAGGLVAGTGYWDDHQHIPARWRILLHFGAGGLASIWLGGLSPLQFGAVHLDFGWFAYPLGAVFLVWLLNLYNFMDGIDGIAGSEAAVAVVGATIIVFALPNQSTQGPQSLWLLQLSLAAASLGFLLWNWPPAKIFMGDVGSGFVGFVIGIFALSSAASGLLPLWSWLILLEVFLVDATLTLIRRMLRSERWFEAHRSHAYQHAAQRWGSHRRVTLGVILINLIWLLPLAWLAAMVPQRGWLIAILAAAPLIFLALWLGAGSTYTSEAGSGKQKGK